MVCLVFLRIAPVWEGVVGFQRTPIPKSCMAGPAPRGSGARRRAPHARCAVLDHHNLLSAFHIARGCDGAEFGLVLSAKRIAKRITNSGNVERDEPCGEPRSASTEGVHAFLPVANHAATEQRTRGPRRTQGRDQRAASHGVVARHQCARRVALGRRSRTSIQNRPNSRSQVGVIAGGPQGRFIRNPTSGGYRCDLRGVQGPLGAHSCPSARTIRKGRPAHARSSANCSRRSCDTSRRVCTNANGVPRWE